MEKRKIKVAFVDFWRTAEQLKKSLLVHFLEKNYEIELSDDPDYVFSSSFGLFNTGVLKYKKAVRIFVSSENLWPDFDLYDYTVTCYPLQYGDRNLTHPYCFDHKDHEMNIALAKNKHLSAKEDLAKKTGFCSFVVSNAQADPIRDAFFEKLCAYKKVDSGGYYKNNIGTKDGIQDKLAFTSERKFSITFENSKVDGYVTEKILEGFSAHTIPIYWGCQEVVKYFNPEAFIYISGPEDVDAAIEMIKYLDNNDEAYLNMLSQPALVSTDIADQVYQEMEEFLKHIIEQPLEKAYRRPRYGFAWFKETRLEIAARTATPIHKTKAFFKKILKRLRLISQYR